MLFGFFLFIVVGFISDDLVKVELSRRSVARSLPLLQSV